jgi:hypothetical protein
MERLVAGGFEARLRRPGWEARRVVRAALRRTGLFWPGLLLCAAAAAAGLAVGHGQAEQAGMLAARPLAAVPVAAPAAADAGQAGARKRLHAFDAQLLPHGDIPFALQDLLELGAAEGLSMQRGSYRAQPDIAGQFLRYRMSLPVQGSAQAIQRFIKSALRKQKNLALDGVQFKRTRIGSPDIEARIDWVLLVTMPGAAQ